MISQDWFGSRLGLALLAGLVLATSAPAQAALLPGDIALIGQIDNVLPGSPIGDLFTFVALKPISAGETIYFTDNGWTGSQYRSVTATDGNGNEQLVRWTAVNPIAAGAIIRSNTASADYTWTATGVIPGASPAEQFSYLDLNQTGDQITAFQASGTNLPMQNWSVNLFTLDDTDGFENATSSQTGGIATGLTLNVTAISHNLAAGNNLAFNTSSLSNGSKDLWLSAIAHPSNWTSNTGLANPALLPSGTVSLTSGPTGSTGANLRWAGAGTRLFEINNASGLAGANWDSVTLSGQLEITATPGNQFTIDVNSLTALNTSGDAPGFNPTSDYSWTLATATGGISGFDPAAFLLDLSGFTNPTAGGTFTLAQLGSSLVLQFDAAAAAVPEPTSLVAWLSLGGLLGLARYRQRRYSAAL